MARLGNLENYNRYYCPNKDMPYFVRKSDEPHTECPYKCGILHTTRRSYK